MKFALTAMFVIYLNALSHIPFIYTHISNYFVVKHQIDFMKLLLSISIACVDFHKNLNIVDAL